MQVLDIQSPSAAEVLCKICMLQIIVLEFHIRHIIININWLVC